MSNQYFSICGLLCIILLLVVFFCKEKINSIETKLYGIMLISSFLDVLLVMYEVSFGYMNLSSIPYGLLKILNRIDMIYYIFWPTLLFLYMFYITYKNEEKYIKYRNLCCVLDIIFIIIEFFLPINIINDNGKMGVDGMATNFVLMIATIYFIAILIIIIKNFKTIKLKKCIPYVTLIIFMILAIYLRNVSPTLIVIPAIMVYIDLIMYFTIENPDIKMLNEMHQNKSLVESSMEDKSLFLFKMSQEVKQPLKNVNDLINEYNNGNLTEEQKNQNYAMIESNIDNLNFIINDIINVSDVDISKIKLVDISYNVNNFFESVRRTIENSIDSKKVKLNYSISKSLPEELYGDYIKLKQVLITIINNSIKYTEEGVIDFEIDSITRYDLCRMIITIKDTGCGMPLNQINDILSNSYEFEDKEYRELDKLNLNLEMSIKLIRLLGGNISIKSDLNQGTQVTIILDQKVKKKEKTDISKDVSNYTTTLFGNRRVLIVDDDSDEINKIVKILTKDNVQTNISMFGKDCIDKIKAGEKYKLILMDDEMKPDNALPTLEKLKEIKKFNIPVIVMLNKEKEFIKEHYIKDGFTDYILKDKMIEEIDRIIKTYM